MNQPADIRAATLTGAQAVVEMLRGHGVEIVFGLCGDTSLRLYDALRTSSLRHVLTRDERHAAYMADGYARVTGKVGVCEGPSGGGATYILPGLAEANESSIPVLAINTDISVSSRGRYTLTELDQRSLMRPVTKWNAVLDRAADIPHLFRQAFEAITSGRPGAAHIALPFDVQSAPVEAADVWADPTLGVYPWRGVAPDPEVVELAAKLLRSAKNPLFICGGGVIISRAEAELTELAEKLAGPVATTISGKGSIDERCAHSVGVVGSYGGTPETRAIVDGADLIVFVGCRAGCVTTERRRPPAAGPRPRPAHPAAGRAGGGLAPARGRGDAGRRSRHAVPVLLRLSRRAWHRPALLLQPGAWRARLRAGRRGRRALRPATRQDRGGDGRRQLRHVRRRARDARAAENSAHRDRHFQCDLWLDQGWPARRLRPALLLGRLQRHRPCRRGARLWHEELARHRAGGARADAQSGARRRRADARRHRLPTAPRSEGAGVGVGRMIERGHHDMGGLPAGKVERTKH